MLKNKNMMYFFKPSIMMTVLFPWWSSHWLLRNDFLLFLGLFLLWAYPTAFPFKKDYLLCHLGFGWFLDGFGLWALLTWWCLRFLVINFAWNWVPTISWHLLCLLWFLCWTRFSFPSFTWFRDIILLVSGIRLPGIYPRVRSECHFLLFLRFNLLFHLNNLLFSFLWIFLSLRFLLFLLVYFRHNHFFWFSLFAFFNRPLHSWWFQTFIEYVYFVAGNSSYLHIQLLNALLFICLLRFFLLLLCQSFVYPGAWSFAVKLLLCWRSLLFWVWFSLRHFRLWNRFDCPL